MYFFFPKWDDNKEYAVSYDTFKNLYLVGELTEEQITMFVKRFLEDDKIARGSGTKVEQLKDFRRVINNLMISLDEKISDFIIEEKSKEEKERDKFLDQFSEVDFMSKNEINRLCGIHKLTLKKYNDSFLDKGTKGVQLKSFLPWLKIYDPKKYEQFKQAFKR